jgi:hypothetical protein
MLACQLVMLNFYRRFLPHAAATQAPLHDALSGPRVKGSHPITWTPDLHRAFEECKASSSSLSSATLLARPDPSAPLALRHRRLHFRHGCRPAATCRQRLATPRLFLETQYGTVDIQSPHLWEISRCRQPVFFTSTSILSDPFQRQQDIHTASLQMTASHAGLKSFPSRTAQPIQCHAPS